MINVFANDISCDTQEETKVVQDILTKITGFVPEVFKVEETLRVMHDQGEFKMAQILLNRYNKIHYVT